MMGGPGFVSQKQAAWDETNDLRYVWTAGDITPLYKPSELEGIPGTPEEAWGEAFMKNVLYVANRPLMPWPHWFIPRRQNPDQPTRRWTMPAIAGSSTPASPTSWPT